MIDQIIAYLRDHPDGVSSPELSERFLKFKNPGHDFALRAIQGILGKDKRCRYDENGRWFGLRAATAVASLKSLPWIAVHALASHRAILHLSLWSVVPEPQPLLNAWLSDPLQLAPEEQELLMGPHDAPFVPDSRNTILNQAISLLSGQRTFFFSSQQHALFSACCAYAGEVLTDDFTLASHLFRSSGLSMPRPLELSSAYSALLCKHPSQPSAGRQGQMLAECLIELLERLSSQGIETETDLEAKENREVAEFDFTGKDFSSNDILALPCQPGVYGFKDKAGTFIYIGKATDLRRRVSGYFKKTDESPEKLFELRSKAKSLMTHVCGSELECLLYEYRLIHKYSPLLNTQRFIDERKGSYRPIQDCIILLPHAESDKGISLWFRGSQKISIKPFPADFGNVNALADELQAFFFSGKLPAATTDFPEQEIAARWIRRHRDSLLIVPADRMTSGTEILAAMQSYWQDRK